MNAFDYFKRLDEWGYEILMSTTDEAGVYRLSGEALDFHTGQVISFSTKVWGEDFTPENYGLPSLPDLAWESHRNGVSGFPFRVAYDKKSVYVRFARQVGAHVFHPINVNFITDYSLVIDVEGGQVIYWMSGDERMVGFLETGGVRESKFAAFNLDSLLDGDVRFFHNSYRGDVLLEELIQKGIIHE